MPLTTQRRKRWGESFELSKAVVSDEPQNALHSGAAMSAMSSRSDGLENLDARDLVRSPAELDAKYREALVNMPASGGGGCHVSLLRVANLGRAAGYTREQVAKDLAEHVHGSRRVPFSEIEAAVRRAFSTTAPIPKPEPDFDVRVVFESFLKRGRGATATELWEASPIRIDWPVERDAIELLSRLYAPNEHLFIGSRYETGAEHVLAAAEWIQRFERGLAAPEHIIPNPLSGKPADTKDGKSSYRADSCVARFPIILIEFDNLPREQQIEFWAGQPLDVYALIDSGGKSIHGWVSIEADDADAWTDYVEGQLFPIFTRMGVDSSCQNEARLSRMPGHFRVEKRRYQRLLYLNPKGDCPVKQ